MKNISRRDFLKGAAAAAATAATLSLTGIPAAFAEEEKKEKELLIPRPIDEVVIAYAQNAAAAGLDGVVCSPLEAGKVHRACGEGFLTVTPGVRFADGDKGDQKRVTTPAQAKDLGSDFIVVGRPITAAADPVAAWHRCRKEFL
jgi:orotidine-5'-phosphate decarboxylase